MSGNQEDKLQTAPEPEAEGELPADILRATAEDIINRTRLLENDIKVG